MRKICTKYGRQRSFANLVLRSTNGPKLLSFSSGSEIMLLWWWLAFGRINSFLLKKIQPTFVMFISFTRSF